jgi:hypothetical protein
MSPREFDSEFRKYGDVITSCLKTDDDGNSLKYGYVQFAN